MIKGTKTQYFPNLIDKDTADNAYKYLEENVKWVDGIFSTYRGRMSRKAYQLNVYNMTDVDEYINNLVIDSLTKTYNMHLYILGTYVNYYRDGNDFAPSHSHPKQVQMIISLGATRTLKVGKKEFKMNSGDVIIFGTSEHGVPIEADVKDGRISIATFMLRL